MSNPFTGGGKVKYVPGKVKTPLEEDVPQEEMDALRAIALERDLLAADLLDGDRMLDLLDAAIDDQMKDFELPAGGAKDSARRLCGSDTINWECYKKAKELVRAIPMLANGYDPVQLVFGGDELTKRKGPVIYNCEDFDSNKFFDPTYESGDSPRGGMGIAPGETGTESPQDIQKRAHENQKKWGMMVMFWELIWGRPAIQERFLAQWQETKENIQALQDKIAALEGEGKKKEAEALAKQLAFQKLPDLIREERPTKYSQMQWEAFPPDRGPLDSIKANPKLAAGAWINPWDQDEYADKGLPVIKQGFLLSLLIGALGLPVKVITKIIGLKNKIVSKFDVLDSIPVVGSGVFKAWKAIVDLIFVPYVYINNVFVEICIWLAMKPTGYKINVGKVPPEFEDDIGEMGVASETVTDTLEVEDTPAGFVPPECMVAAQEVVTRVNNYAST